MMWRCGLVLLINLGAGWSVSAQRPISLAEAISVAQAHNPRIAAALADSASARAQAVVARAFPNPDINLLYTRDPPRNHLLISQGLEYPWVRSARIRSATAAERAAEYNVEVERYSLRYDVEVAYAHAAALKAIHRLSERSAHAAEELLRIARKRNDDGDAEELDVHHAAVIAGQAALAEVSDSSDAVSAILDLQVLLGLDTSEVVITPSDSLVAPPPVPVLRPRPLSVSIAELQVQAEEANVILTRRGLLPTPSIQIGFDRNDPGGEGNKLLPVYGVTFTIPIWDRKRGDVAAARAAQARAAALLAQARIEARIAHTQAEKQRALLKRKIAIGSDIMRNAEEVVTLTMEAYREGRISLPDALEGLASAREAIRDYLLTLGAMRGAEAAHTRAQVVGRLPLSSPASGVTVRGGKE